MVTAIQSYLYTTNDRSNYLSPVAAGFNNKSLLQGYIKAKLTDSNTTRILLDAEEYQFQKNAIAAEIAEQIIQNIRSLH